MQGDIELVARSNAPLVRFTMEPRDKFKKFVEVTNGVARATFSSYGLDNRVPIGAASCTSQRECGDTVHVHVVVKNPAPRITSPANKARIYPIEDLTVRVEAPGGRVYLGFKGFDRLPLDGDEPYRFVLDADRLRAGDPLHVCHSVQWHRLALRRQDRRHQR